MVDGTDGPVGSGAMEATPALDADAPAPRPGFARRGARGRADRGRADLARAAAAPAADDPVDRRPARRSSPSSCTSTASAWRPVPELILQANPALVLLAFVVFYLGFPLRGYRWERLLRETGFVIGLRNSTEILYLSWFVNCVVPAKLGDVYRAYLLKMNSPASLSRTFGTVFIERILDIFAIAILGLAAGFWSFRSGLPRGDPGSSSSSASWSSSWPPSGCSRCATSAGGSSSGCRCRRAILELYERFEEGVFGAVGLRHLPILAILTGLIWLTEGLRLYIVVLALGFPDVELGLSGAVFVALIGSLLTAIPLSPAGLGFAQAGVIGVLTVAYGVPLPEATAITILDWVISVLSIIVFGAIAVRRLADAARDGPDPAAARPPRPHRPPPDGRDRPSARPSAVIRSATTDVPRSRGPRPATPGPHRDSPHLTAHDPGARRATATGTNG